MSQRTSEAKDLLSLAFTDLPLLLVRVLDHTSSRIRLVGCMYAELSSSQHVADLVTNGTVGYPFSPYSCVCICSIVLIKLDGVSAHLCPVDGVCPADTAL